MQKKRSNWSVLGKIVSYFKYLLRARNVIIISEQKVDHIPLSPSVQMLGLLGILGFIMWASYSTGSFMAARSVVKEKDRKIAYSKMENRVS